MGNTSLTIVYHIKKKPKYRIVFEFLNLMTLSDYLAFLKGKVGYDVDLIDDGMDCNSWEARPWDKDEKLHPTNWVVSESISFLQRRDPTVNVIKLVI
ncbi:arylsulfatase [Streptococcus pneumoniae]|nr:arylsulfatase [Streptococcus pneumoniae]VOL54995.1 arylsulfatase [Streptococcus pneumoniae]